MTDEKLKQEIADWWKIKFHVELKDDICQVLHIDEVEELCNLIAKLRENHIVELEAYNEKLLDGDIEKHNKIVELEQKLEQTEKDLADYQFNYPTIKELQKENAELKLKLEALEGQTPWQ